MFLSAKDFAKEVNLPIKTVRTLCKTKRIPSFTIGNSNKYQIEVEPAKKILHDMCMLDTRPSKNPKVNYLDALKNLKAV